jgi:hypothetical protein
MERVRESPDRPDQHAAGPAGEEVMHAEKSPDFKGAHGFVFQVETMGKGVAAILIGGTILAVLLAGMALVRTEATAEQARIAEREARVATERWNDLKVELARRGIPVSDH